MGTPLYDTVGSGLSFLDTVLHARVNAQGIVEKTLTRMLLVGKITQGSASNAGLELQRAHSLVGAEAPDTTGLLVLAPGSFFDLLESPVETVVALLRELCAVTKRGDAPFDSLRVVACVEDCPSRCFGPWSLREVVVPSEAPVNLEDASTVQLAVDLMSALTGVGHQLMDLVGHSGDFAAVLEQQLQEPRFTSQFPSDEKLSAIAASDKFASAGEWLELFAEPASFSTSAEEVYPMPPRVAY